MKTITELWGEICSVPYADDDTRIALIKSAVELEKAKAQEELAHAIVSLIEHLENKPARYV